MKKLTALRTGFNASITANLAFILTLSALSVTACGSEPTTSETQQLSIKHAENKVANKGTLATLDFSSSTVYFSEKELAKLPSDSSAHWLTPTLLVLAKTSNDFHYKLLSAKADGVKRAGAIASGYNDINLSATNFPQQLINKFPQLANFQAYQLDLTTMQSKLWLKQKLFVVALDSHNKATKISYVQTAAVLDALYTQGNNDADEVSDLGASIIANPAKISFKLWAPTAQQVKLLVFNDDLTPKKTPMLTMTEDSHTGIWSVVTESSLKGSYYQYQIDVYSPKSKKNERLISTDPYSLSLSVNSKYSQVVDLNDSATQPQNWSQHIVPKVNNVEDNIFYEVHIRDFSANDSALSNSEFRGKYQAFSEQDSYGIRHLKALKKAGLNNIHLLPTFDIATVNEDSTQAVDLHDSLAEVKAKVCDIEPSISLCTARYNEQQSLHTLLSSFAVNSSDSQKIVSELRQFDNYNWGYDPFHYTVPEGSYALNPKGTARLVEFRQMIQNIHGLGFRVIMDVVYNHTHQSGLEPNAVLDKIVPNYYHRLTPITGEIEQSTCCDNTATERVMMAKLMTDSLVVWARDYKIDGFRFDLMGHQPKAAMLTARMAVKKVDSDTYFYGEGWNFGEVANNSQFVQASQLELSGTEIGTYSDRLRDAVRGGGNNTRDSQGLGNGLLLFPNERQSNEKQSNQKKAQLQADYALRMDQLRIGLAGNLANFPLRVVQGKAVLGKDIRYGDQPTGYALDPADTINYVSKHDNQTLWDNSQYRLPFDVSTDDRVRMHLQSLAFPLFAQGIPFIHMGSEFMRSKSFLRDSYDYGDWFNRVDFSKKTNYYHVGLPPAAKDKANWPLIKSVLKGHQGRDQVQAKHIEFSSKVFEQMLTLRMSSPLFRLTSSAAIIAKVSFLNANVKNNTNTPSGLLVMKIDDTQGESVDEKLSSMMVIFNMSNKTQTFTYADSQGYQLHPIQQNGVDEIVKQANVNKQGFSVPPLSSVVFIHP